MDDRIYDYWAATLQDGYIGKLIDIVEAAGGARELYLMSAEKMQSFLGISARLAKYIDEHRPEAGRIEDDYNDMAYKGISYVNHTDGDYPEKLQDIASRPYGLFIKGSLPDPEVPSVAIVGARECSEYGRTMAEYFGNRLAAEGVQIISGMAWGIDGISQEAALSAGGRSYAVMGCGPDIVYPARNRVLYDRLTENGNGIISEYAPATPAMARRFPPRNRIISALSDVLIVVEARAKSGTLITVDMAIEQNRTVMVVPGRLTDSLSAGCLNLLYQGALPATGIDAVMDALGIPRRIPSENSPEGTGTLGKNDESPDASGKKVAPGKSDAARKSGAKKPEAPVIIKNRELPGDLGKVESVLTLDPLSAENIAAMAGMPLEKVMILLTRLELEGAAKELWPGFFVKKPDLA
ncbi:MAG: DNA-processing protein DprA [Lachnospiraceae bacterium]|nr:DNA-processing protein DprA [Lachnospiraceae bacterium]